MIKQINIITFCSLFFINHSLAQTNKPNITPKVFGKFASVASASISNDGNYCVYNINDPSGIEGGSYIKAINEAWQSNRISYGQFTNNSRYYMYKQADSDSLTLFNLQNKTTEYIAGISTFKQTGNLIAYILKSSNQLIVWNTENKKENVFDNVTDFYFNNAGTSLLLVTTAAGLQSLQWVYVDSQKKVTIWTATGKDIKAGSFVFSKTGNELAFIVEAKDGKFIWHFVDGMNAAIEIASEGTMAIDNNLSFENIDNRGFASNGKFLFLSFKGKQAKKTDESAVGIDVWSYKDGKLQSQQLKQLKPRTYLAALDIRNKKIVRIELEDQKFLGLTPDYVLVATLKGDVTYDEWFWNKAAYSSVDLISLIDGTNKSIADNLPAVITTSYWLSPAGKYVVYYDPEAKNYFSYEIATGTRKNITKGVPAVWSTYLKSDIPMAKFRGAVGLYGGWIPCGWIEKDSAVILYAQSDIYQVDLSGKTKPVNLTNGIGQKNNIEFRSAIDNSSQVLKYGDQLIVSAFNRINKNDGFYRVTVGRNNPEFLTSQPYVFKGTWEDERFIPTQPIKATNANVYMVRRMSAEESPNFFWTSDFKKFNRITTVTPERSFNWLTTELVTWKLPDGTTSQGILYKPENFDSSKKYPVIFHYYEQMSQSLHAFINPDASHGDLNIPYFVSNGYLVFTPDIHYTIGRPGQSVLTTMVSAASHLSKLPYVDAKHMGLQGHSRGGWETNYIITHNKLFAAAVSASGWANYVSSYNEIRFRSSGISRQGAYEMLFQRMGANLWQAPERYIENSPIFKADKIVTPVLMMNNKEDNDVYFDKGVELYSALRRLGKRAWMLQYDDGEHMVFDKSAVDFTIRMKHFFDHYLKGEPAPKWMLYGIPAKDKGMEDGLQLVREKDKNGNWITPGPGLLKTN